MLKFKVTETAVVATEERGEDVQSRNDWKTFEAAQEIAARANETEEQTLYLAVDSGPYIYPRYDVVRLPQIGDDVSYGFNGDYYPCGEITKISKTLKKIETSTGAKFYRKRETGSWLKDGMWSLVRGVHDRRNPSF